MSTSKEDFVTHGEQFDLPNRPSQTFPTKRRSERKAHLRCTAMKMLTACGAQRQYASAVPMAQSELSQWRCNDFMETAEASRATPVRDVPYVLEAHFLEFLEVSPFGCLPHFEISSFLTFCSKSLVGM